MRTRSLTIVAIIASVVLTIGPRPAAGMDDAKPDAPMMSRPVVGKPYKFAIKDINGQMLRSGDMLGKVVVIDFWVSWCEPCHRATAVLKRLHKKHSGKLEIVGVSLDDSVDKILAYTKKNGAGWPQVFGRGKAAPAVAEARQGVNGIPHYLVIDKLGILHKTKIGGSPPEKLIGTLVGAKD